MNLNTKKTFFALRSQLFFFFLFSYTPSLVDLQKIFLIHYLAGRQITTLQHQQRVKL
jgi:hypothetical protein